MIETAGDFGRFLTAQQGVFEQALAELRRGRKESHWMWFVFPQIAGLGRSAMATHYAIGSMAEARAYLGHPELGHRLAESTDAVLVHAGRRSAEAILGSVDAVKFRSSMTLFEAAGGGARYRQALDLFYGGEADPATVSLLA